jgi:predicted Zn-dependent protease
MMRHLSAARRFPTILRLCLAVLLSFGVMVRPVLAQSVLRDAETEALLNDMARPLVVAAGLQPGNVEIVLLHDKEINAFVAGGQAVYIHSGLIAAADNANEVQGVIAHEIGHIAGGHIVRFGEGAKAATGITLLSLLLGAAAMAAGGAEAGMGMLMAGQQAAMGKFLAYSRVQEGSADAAGASYLAKANVTGKGILSFFGKLRSQEYRLSSSYADIDPYAQTHPLSGDRMATLETALHNAPSWNTPPDTKLEERFQRVKAKLAGYTEDPQTTLRIYPESNQSVPAHYARAYAWHRAAYPDKAGEEVAKLVQVAPHDPYFLELQGQILLESGKPKEAIPPLREAVDRSGNAPLISALLGHALIASEDTANFAEARRVLKVAVARDSDNPFAWYQLGVVYSREGDQARAALATAERYNLTGQNRLALASAEMAMRGIPQGTPDYLRAQDIAMVSRTAAEQEKKRR